MAIAWRNRPLPPSASRPNAGGPPTHGVASRRKRAQGLSYQGDPMLPAISGSDEQTDPSQAGRGCAGAAVEHLFVYVEGAPSSPVSTG